MLDDFDMNRLSAATRPVNFFTSLTFLGDYMFIISLIWLGFASIPLCVTMQPKNVPAATPNVRLVGLSFIPYILRTINASEKCWM